MKKKEIESANIDKRVLSLLVQSTCKELGWANIIYAGIVGSSLATLRNRDIDIIVVTSTTPEIPSLIHHQHVSLLAFSKDWLKYEKHLEKPTGLVPSILFKSLELSEPLIGNKNDLDIPMIKVSRADWINIEIKKKRYENLDKKNYVVALLFEKLLAASPDLSKYSFDNIKMADNLGEKQIANVLLELYNELQLKKTSSLYNITKNRFRNSMKEKSKDNLKKFLRENQKERFRFIDQWAEYVRTHSDKDWSRQQNVIINSCIRTASMTKEQYLAMKKVEQEMKAGKKVKRFNQKDAVKYLKSL